MTFNELKEQLVAAILSGEPRMPADEVVRRASEVAKLLKKEEGRSRADREKRIAENRARQGRDLAW